MRMKTQMLCVVFLLIFVTSSCSGEHGRQKRQSPLCDPQAEYRETDNFCNNLMKPKQGAAFDVLSRSLPPVYDDGVGTPRQESVGGGPLPHPRIISTTVHMERKIGDRQHSTMLMQWGQFINHDMVATPNTTDSEGDITDCCKLQTDVTDDSTSECFPIHVGKDPYFNTGRCINFVRSQPESGTGTSQAKPRVTFNGASGYIDASHIYGPFKELESLLRENSGGRLRVKPMNGKDFPPKDTPEKCFEGNKPNSYCFLTGDARANVFVGLSALHVIFLREHNRIAGILAGLHGDWDDDKLFQEAKKIVVAELQIITYRDWLPLILGPFYTSLYGITEPYEYLPSMNARISNAFATSAMRFGHSMIPDSLQIGGQTRFVADLISTTAPVIDSLENVLEGILQGANNMADPWFVNDMTRFMFQTSETVKDGYDIVSLNIQRGRDHGVPAYNEWRRHCKLGVVSGFTDEVFYTKAAADMEKVYKSIQDVDLFTGSMSEWPVPGGVVGDTNACLLADQFMKVKFGDRFFWETTNEKIGFSSKQRQELTNVSLGRILCDNTDISTIQKNPFLKEESSTNPKVACSTLPTIDLKQW